MIEYFYKWKKGEKIRIKVERGAINFLTSFSASVSLSKSLNAMYVYVVV